MRDIGEVDYIEEKLNIQVSIFHGKPTEVLLYLENLENFHTMLLKLRKLF